MLLASQQLELNQEARMHITNQAMHQYFNETDTKLMHHLTENQVASAWLSRRISKLGLFCQILMNRSTLFREKNRYYMAVLPQIMCM